MKQRMHFYYLRILKISFLILFILIIAIASIYSVFSWRTFQDQNGEVAELTVNKVSDSLSQYFENLDENLSKIYESPVYLATLNDYSYAEEQSSRNLIAGTSYMRDLRSIRIYNSKKELRSFYSRVRTSEYNQKDVFASDQEAAAGLESFLKDDPVSGSGIAILFPDDDARESYVRVVKKLYQQAGRVTVGCIVCDLKLQGLLNIIRKDDLLGYQHIWLSSAYHGYLWLNAPENSRKIPEKYLSYEESDFTSAPGSALDRFSYYRARSSSMGTVCGLYIDKENVRRNVLSILSTAFIGLIVSIVVYIIAFFLMRRTIAVRIGGVTSVVGEIAGGKQELRLPVSGNDEISLLCSRFNDLLDRLRDKTRAEKETEKALAEARYSTLQTQVNPHFLYNTMETMGAIALANNCPMITQMCDSLSMMMRYSIQYDTSDREASLKDELRYVKNYMYIMNIRTSDSIRYEENIDPKLSDCLMPKITIQPLIDNAIRHGLRNKRGDRIIRLTAKEVGGVMQIMVEDNGSEDSQKIITQVIESGPVSSGTHTSIGINNINQRIRLLYGKDFGMRCRRVDGFTQIIVTVPVHMAETGQQGETA